MEREVHTDVVRSIAVDPRVGSEGRGLVSFCVAMAAFCGIVVAGWVFQSTSLAGWQKEHLHWNFILHGLMFLVPMISMAMLGRSGKEYGLRVPAWREGMAIGVSGAAIFLGFVSVGLLLGVYNPSRVLAAFPMNTIIYQVVFVAVFEEVFFRGFLQHELGRSWPGRGSNLNASLRFGWIATAFLFALGHGLGGFNPLLHAYRFDIGAFLITFALGCVLGLLRERSGSIWPCVVLHLASNISTTIFLKPVSTSGQILLLMGFYTALPLVVFWCVRKRADNPI